jgi:BlaI family transcriptional regulator, penicillinase repressor
MNRKTLDDLGDLQKRVMELIWQLGEATVSEVRDCLSGKKSPAYTTILTILQKLEKTGWLKHRVEGRTYIYQPVCSREDESARSLRTYLGKVFHGDPLMLFQHLLRNTTLPEKDWLELKKLIDKKRKGGT